MLLEFSFITGLMFGIEHVSGDEDDDFYWAIALNLGILCIALISFREE